MSSPLGEYAQKAINASLVILKMKRFLASDDPIMEISREEAEAILLTFKEFSQAMRNLGGKR